MGGDSPNPDRGYPHEKESGKGREQPARGSRRRILLDSAFSLATTGVVVYKYAMT